MENEPIIKKQMTDSITELAKALSLAQAAMGPAIKDKQNPFFKSSYADLASVWEACREPLTKNGLSVTQLVNSEGATIKLTTMLIHASGEYISSELCMKAEKETPQGLGSAITYARRYALAAIVGISSDDDDAEAANANGKPKVDKPLKKGEQVPQNDALTKAKADLVKAQKLVGDEAFFKVLGNEGLEKIDQITNAGVAVQILRDLETVYKDQQKK